jgi:hypothetical protein
MKKFVILMTITLGMCSLAASCPPKFFKASDADGGQTNTLAHLSPQKTMPHGRLNAVAKLDGDTVAIISKLHDNRRLGVYDPTASDWVYLCADGTTNDYVAGLIKNNHFKVRPAPNNSDSYASVDMWWRNPNTDAPVLLIDFSDLLVTQTHKVGTIYEITIEGLYGNSTAAFKADNTAMSTDDRVFHVRWGDGNDSTAPTIEATNLPSEGTTVALDFRPEITYSEELGAQYVWLYSGETSSGNTIEYTDFWPFPVYKQLRDSDSGNVKYTMGGNPDVFEDWDSNTLYHLFIVAEVEAAAGDLWGMLGDMPATQDLSGNRVTCPTGTEVDVGTYTGGSAVNVKACVGRFLTK